MILLSIAMGSAILGEFIVPSIFPGTSTRVRGKALVRPGFAASSELTLPGDAKEAQKKQAELSHAG